MCSAMLLPQHFLSDLLIFILYITAIRSACLAYMTNYCLVFLESHEGTRSFHQFPTEDRKA
jgi:hypothetical protein